MRKAFGGCALLLVLAGCGSRQPQSLTPLADEFVYTTLAFSPVNSTAQGYHQHRGKDLDSQLDDFSQQAISEQRNFYSGFHQRLEKIDKNSLSPEDRADYDIMKGQIALSQFDLDLALTWRRSPTMYVELAGSAIFAPFVLEYAPLPDRMRHIIARLEKFPDLMRRARQAILEDRYPAFVKDFFGALYEDSSKYPGWAVDALREVGVNLREDR